MKNKVFSGLEELPRGDAPSGYIDGCMALEGGAFRGVYTSGVLDYLMQKGVNLRTCVGVSAGALNGVNYISGQIGRSGLCNLKHRHDSRWVGTTALRTDKGLIGFDFLKGGLEEEYPFNKERFLDPGHRLVAVATNINTGKPEYFDSQAVSFENIGKAVAASASMPFVSRPVTIGRNHYLDGGCVTKLPIRWALEQGFEKIVFVASREAEYRRKEKDKEGAVLRAFYNDFPKLREAITNANTRYNEDCDLIDKLVEEGRIFRIAPSERVTVSRLEGDMEKLGALYYLGYRDAEANYDALREYLSR